MRKRLIASLTVLTFLLLLTSCAVSQRASKSEAFVASWDERDKSRLVSLKGLETTTDLGDSLYYEAEIEIVGCSDEIERIKSEFGTSLKISSETYLDYPDPLERLEVTEIDGRFPEDVGYLELFEEVIFDGVIGRLVTWDNIEDADLIAGKCDEDHGEGENGPVGGDWNDAEWVVVSFDEEGKLEEPIGPSGYKSLPLVALVDKIVNAAPVVLALIILFGGIAIKVRRRQHEKELIR